MARSSKLVMPKWAHLGLTMLLVAGVLFILVENFLRLVNAPSVPLLFATTPGRLVFTENLAGMVLENGRKDETPYDAIRKGDVLVAVDDEPVLDEGTFKLKLFQARRNESFYGESFVFTVLRPTQRQSLIRCRVQLDYLPTEFVDEVPPSVYVFEVPQASSSARAGMQVGDLLVSLNGHPLHTALQARTQLESLDPGQNVAIRIVRRGEFKELSVPIARVNISFRMLVVALIALLYLALGAFLLFFRFRLRAARLTGLALFLLGSFFAAAPNRDHLAPGFDVMARLTLIWFGYFVGLAVLFRSRFYFPQESRDDNLAHRAVPAWLTFFCFAWGVNQGAVAFWPGTLAMGGHYFWYYRNHRAGIKKKERLSTWFLDLGILCMVVAGWFVVRNQASDLANHVFAAVVPFALMPISYVDAITRYRLLNLRWRVSRNFQFSVLAVFYTAVFFTLYGMVLRWLALGFAPLPGVRLASDSIEVFFNRDLAAHSDKATHFSLILVGILFTLASMLLFRRGFHLLRRNFHRVGHDFQRAHRILAEALGNGRTPKELAETLSLKLCELMLVKKAGAIIFQADRQAGCFEAFGIDSREWVDFCSQDGQHLMEALSSYRNEMCVDYLPDDFKRRFRAWGIRYLFPIHSKVTCLGCIVVGEKLSETSYAQAELSFLLGACQQVSVAIENAFLYQRVAVQERLNHELALARSIQLSSLPQETPAAEGLEITGISIPALEVGGDYYDYLPGDGLSVLVGDVSGKGTTAALYMSKVQGIFHALAALSGEPRDLLVKANAILYRDLERGYYLSALLTHFCPVSRHVLVVRAGHLPLFHYLAKEKTVKRYQPSGMALGLENKGLFERVLAVEQVSFFSDDVFILATDGLTEAMDPLDRPFGEDRLAELLADHAHLSALGIRDALLEEVREYAGENVQQDDQTLVVVKVLDPPSASLSVAERE